MSDENKTFNAETAGIFEDVSIEIGEDVIYHATDGYNSKFAAKVIAVRHSIAADILVFNAHYPFVHLVSNVLVGIGAGTIQKKPK